MKDITIGKNTFLCVQGKSILGDDDENEERFRGRKIPKMKEKGKIFHPSLDILLFN